MGRTDTLEQSRENPPNAPQMRLWAAERARLESQLETARQQGSPKVLGLQRRLQLHEGARPVAFTMEELRAAAAVRLGHGWVVPSRVTEKNVIVRGPDGLKYRHRIHNVLEVRL